jgi:hypothetical protein
VGARSDGGPYPYQDQRLSLSANPCVTITVNSQGLFWADLDESPSPDGASGFDCVNNSTSLLNPRSFQLTLPNPGHGDVRSPCKILCTLDNCGTFNSSIDDSCVLTLRSIAGLPDRNVNPRLRVDGLYGKRSPAQGFGFLFRVFDGTNLVGSYTITSTSPVAYTIPGGNSNQRAVTYQGNVVVNLVGGPSNSGPVSDPFPFYIKFTAERVPLP